MLILRQKSFLGEIFVLLQISVSKILAQSRLWCFKTTKILQKWLQTWFILFHLSLVWNVRVKSILSHSAPHPLKYDDVIFGSPSDLFRRWTHESFATRAWRMGWRNGANYGKNRKGSANLSWQWSQGNTGKKLWQSSYVLDNI